MTVSPWGGNEKVVGQFPVSRQSAPNRVLRFAQRYFKTNAFQSGVYSLTNFRPTNRRSAGTCPAACVP
jgi:hypothetical protein